MRARVRACVREWSPAAWRGHLLACLNTFVPALPTNDSPTTPPTNPSSCSSFLFSSSIAHHQVMVMTRWQAAQKKTGYKASQWFQDQKKLLARQQLKRLGGHVLAQITNWTTQLAEKWCVRPACGLCVHACVRGACVHGCAGGRVCVRAFVGVRACMRASCV